MRVDVGPLGGNLLDIAAVISKVTFLDSVFFLFTLSPFFFFLLLTVLFSSSDNSTVLLTPSLASQCGFSVRMDQLGNAMIYASLQNCFAEYVVTRPEIFF